MNVLGGTIISQCQPRHRHQEWLKFLKLIKAQVPEDRPVHLICDNYATHKPARVQAWAKRNPRFTFHFTPTGASWLNMIERFFRDLDEKALKPLAAFHPLWCLATLRGGWTPSNSMLAGSAPEKAPLPKEEEP